MMTGRQPPVKAMMSQRKEGTRWELAAGNSIFNQAIPALTI